MNPINCCEFDRAAAASAEEGLLRFVLLSAAFRLSVFKLLVKKVWVQIPDSSL